jgi:SNF2 family DNA or RNA helicase
MIFINEESNTTIKTKQSVVEILFGSLFSKIIIDKKSSQMIIKGINYVKFLNRIKQMYDSRGLTNLFTKEYSKWDIIRWNKEMINKSQMKISSLSVPIFFALEIYKIFMDLADFYQLPFYREVARKIYKNTWVSKYENRQNINIETDLTNLDNLSLKPLDYQREFIASYQSIKYTYELEGYILSFDQGLGKTFTSIGVAETIPNLKQVIIVCPNTLKENWAFEIKSYYNKYSNDKVWMNEIFIFGNPKFDNFNSNTRFIIVSMDSISKIFKYCKKDGVMIIVDESHNFRNIDSQRSQELLNLKYTTNCNDVLLMSGTPIKATPDELIPALRMIDPYFTDELSSMYRKAFSNNSIYITNVVKERFSRTIYRRTKESVLKLPEKYISDLYFKIKNPELFYVNKISSDILEVFNIEYNRRLPLISSYKNDFYRLVLQYSSESRTNTMNYLKYATEISDNKDMNIHEHRQEIYDNFMKLSVYPNIYDMNILKQLKFIETQYLRTKNVAMGIAVGRILPKARTDVYLKIYDENKSKFYDMIESCTKKTIIFSPFLQVINHIYSDLQSNNIGCVKIVGETKDRMDLIQRFKNEDVIDVLLATTQTLSTGVTLTEASQMLFFGVPYRSADYNQACDRIHRIGQTQDVYIYTILLDSEGNQKNITERINDIMRWSGDMFDSLITESEFDERIDMIY